MRKRSRLVSLLGVIVVFVLSGLHGVAIAKRSDKPTRSRPTAAQCATNRGTNGKLREWAHSACKTDADCKAGKNGRCTQVYGGGRLPPTNECSYDGCFTDKDCGAGTACECGHSADATTAGEAHQCVAAECKVDADCGAGGFCSPSYSLCSRGRDVGKYYCHTPKDECMVDSDCPPPSEKGYGPTDVKCSFSAPTRRWVCMTEQCPVG